MIGIICGEGKYPQLVVRACEKKKLRYCLVFFGEYDHREYSSTSRKIVLNLGEVSRLLKFFRAHEVKKVVMTGSIKRPSIFDLSLDWMGIKYLIRLWKKLFFSGDDSLLRAVSELFAENGIELISGTDLLDKVFLEEGLFSKRIPSDKEREDILLGLRESQALGALDKGQSVVVSDGEVVSREDASGTDALIDRCYDGILVKTTKPQQDFRMDLPAVGVKTVENMYLHGFKGLVVEADRTIVLDKDEVIKKIDEYGMFFQAVKIHKSTRVFIIAGEPSGDYLGGRLMKDMKKLDDDISFIGIGGQCMEQAGLMTLLPLSKLSVIGIWEVLGKIFYFKKLINRTAEVIIKYKPDVLVTIDSSGFTHRVDRLVKNSHCGIPIVHYVAPPVWAWRKWRARTMHKIIDKLMVLLPFEVDLFTQHKLNTVFVGHPIASDADFTPSVEKSSENLTVTLLPGSRRSEIERHMPILKEFAKLIAKKHPKVRFYLPTVRDVAPLIKEYVRSWDIKPIVSTKKMKKVKAYNLSNVAVAASGTVTLELAKMGLPFVVIYKTSLITYLFAKLLIRVPYVCLVNILAGKNVVPELLQKDCTPNNILTAVEEVMNPQRGMEQKEAFEKIVSQLAVPRSKSAEEVFDTIKKSSSQSR